MSKRLVVCCDGTWNDPKEKGGPTNVYKFQQGVVEGVVSDDSLGMTQITKYQEGVGTSTDHWLGGAFGRGLSAKVRDIYIWIIEHYQPHDELYFVGFSRGAFTARSTVGLIYNCGILRTRDDDLITEAYARYKSTKRRDHPDSLDSRRFRGQHSHEDAAIRFVGVWDTVGALGIPMPGLRIPKFIQKHWAFHDVTLNKHVGGAYQALAIDEKRRPFKPSLWKQERDAPPSQEVEQVWFAGCHRDVGGGEAVPDLSEIALLWMVERAHCCDLAFKPGHFRISDNPGPNDQPTARSRGEIVGARACTAFTDSRTGVYRLAPPYRRPLGAADRHGRAKAEGESVACSVQIRSADVNVHPPSANNSLTAWLKAKRTITQVTST
jgi:uncharacterized protein (DUF2235 family)